MMNMELPKGDIQINDQKIKHTPIASMLRAVSVLQLQKEMLFSLVNLVHFLTLTFIKSF